MGVMEVYFSNDIVVPSNISVINSTAIDIRVIPGMHSNPKNVKIKNWYPMLMTSRMLRIQLKFNYPD